MSPNIRKLLAKREIDASAGVARMRYNTDSPGQEAVYLRKAEQSRKYIADMVANGPVTPVPRYVAAEATRGKLTALEAATLLAQKADEGEVIEVAIDNARLLGKRAVDACDGSEDAVRLAVAEAQATLGAL